MRIQIARGYSSAQLDGLPIGWHQFVRDSNTCLSPAIGLELFEAGVDQAQTLRQPHRCVTLHQPSQSLQARVDIHFAIVEEIVALARCSWFCGFRHGPQVILRGCLTAQRGIAPAILRLLLAPALARHLRIAAPQYRVPVAHRNR